MCQKFVDRITNAIGAWSKRGSDEDAVYFRGTVQQCPKCGALRFKPNDARLQTVDCTLEDFGPSRRTGPLRAP